MTDRAKRLPPLPRHVRESYQPGGLFRGRDKAPEQSYGVRSLTIHGKDAGARAAALDLSSVEYYRGRARAAGQDMTDVCVFAVADGAILWTGKATAYPHKPEHKGKSRGQIIAEAEAQAQENCARDLQQRIYRARESAARREARAALEARVAEHRAAVIQAIGEGIERAPSGLGDVAGYLAVTGTLVAVRSGLYALTDKGMDEFGSGRELYYPAARR